MKKLFPITIVIGALLLIGFFGFRNSEPAENIESFRDSVDVTIDEVSVDIDPVSHATFVMTYGDVLIVNDPVGEVEDYGLTATPHLVLMSDTDRDHFSTSTLASVIGPETFIVAPQAVYDELTAEQASQTTVLANDESVTIAGITITAIPMYNIPMEGPDYRHVKGRGNGYVLDQGETRVYIAGDTEDVEEMRNLTNVDYAFIPMNLPYTMGIEAAADGVLAFAPAVVMPYHYRGPDGLSDVETFRDLVNAGNPEIEVRLLDWYPSSE